MIPLQELDDPPEDFEGQSTASSSQAESVFGLFGATTARKYSLRDGRRGGIVDIDGGIQYFGSGGMAACTGVFMHVQLSQDKILGAAAHCDSNGNVGKAFQQMLADYGLHIPNSASIYLLIGQDRGSSSIVENSLAAAGFIIKAAFNTGICGQARMDKTGRVFSVLSRAEVADTHALKNKKPSRRCCF